MGSPVAVDEWTAWAIGAIELNDEGEVSRWCGVLGEAAAEVSEWEQLAERIREAANQAGFDANAVEVFLQSMGESGQGVELVQTVVGLGDQVPNLYFALRAQPEGAAAADPFGWLRHEHQTLLAGMWGDDWAGHLHQQLEFRWGSDWQGHPDEHKVAWFEDLLVEFTQPEAAESAPAEERLTAALGAAVATVPGAAELSEQELAEVMAEVRARLAKETAS